MVNLMAILLQLATSCCVYLNDTCCADEAVEAFRQTIVSLSLSLIHKSARDDKW